MLDKESKGKARTGECGQGYLMSLLGIDFTRASWPMWIGPVSQGWQCVGCGRSLGLWSPMCVCGGRCSERRKGGPGS